MIGARAGRERFLVAVIESCLRQILGNASEIGAGATIGGGSTINKDAPAGELTVARARQATVRGWKRPVKR